ncbi:signal peptidase I [Petroclostridium sp. X23]|uniref:signal peptidase I n=1 Tax=Petroclostridium sp. X23 TaxID=3045146 RepID=UPI0024AD0146|nr:signal peptidase I [Petroclostridium sp. X23]WHH59427.1 signal peptidase I [Petroclostridium sp. X23]
MDKEHFNIENNENDIAQETSQQSVPVQAFDYKKEIREWVQAIVIALVIALVIRTFVFSLIRVDGQSMVPTLNHNDRLIVVKLMYKPKQGDVIILTPPMHKDTPYVKRVIALPGQTVDIDFENHVVKVDGKPLSEPYINEPIAQRGDVKFPQTVPEDTVFVLGDNRNNSRDSRYSDVGMVPFKAVMGKASLRIWPLNRFGSIYH